MNFAIELTQQEYEQLLILLGYVAGAGEPYIKNMALSVANAINRNNPAWRKYEVEGG